MGIKKTMESHTSSTIRSLGAMSTPHVLVEPAKDSEKPRSENPIDPSHSTRMCCCSSSSSSLGSPPTYCNSSSELFTEPPTSIFCKSSASQTLGGTEFLPDDTPRRMKGPENDVDLLGWMRKTIVHRADLEAIRHFLILDDAEGVCNQAATTKAPKRVRFEHVNVRYYSQVLGNNPACRDGAPVELSWNYFEERKLPIEVFDAQHRRNRTNFKLTALQRSYRLASLGYTHQQVVEAQRRVQHAQRQRHATRTKLRSFVGRWHDRLQERTEAFYASSSESVREHKTRRRALLPAPSAASCAC
jgi:hypothetical protein